MADTVWVRENVGFDVWGYKSSLAHFGMQRLAEYDELILMNYTWFGPVRSFAPLFERMESGARSTSGGSTDSRPGDAESVRRGPGGSTAHAVALDRCAPLDVHQARSGGTTGQTMPMITTYTQSILQHESRFTHHFEQLGFVSAVAFSRSMTIHRSHPALP